MKHLQHYIDKARTRAIQRAKAFYSYTDEHFNKTKEPNVQYSNLPDNLVCPEDTAPRLEANLAEITINAIGQDIEENGMEAIVRRELKKGREIALINLELYPITREEI